MPYGRYQEPAQVKNIKGWGCGWKHNLCDAVVCSAFRRHIDAQLFWSISPSEQRPSLSLRLSACEKWGREESVHFNLSLVPGFWRAGEELRAGEGDLWRGRGAYFNPVPGSQTLLLAINHNIKYKKVWFQAAVLLSSECAAFMANFTEKHEILHLDESFSVWRPQTSCDCAHFRRCKLNFWQWDQTLKILIRCVNRLEQCRWARSSLRAGKKC